MATVELIKNTGTYDVDVVTWTPIQLITDIGVTQLRIYYTTANSSVWTELTKNSWKSSYNGTAQTVSIKNATYTSNGQEVPAYVDSNTHKIKIKRVTSPSLYITFNDGAKLSGRDLNVVNLQCIHLLEEEAARLDVADADIYSYISSQLSGYYTKTQIDGFFDAQTIVPAWVSGEEYTEGAVVIHNDPFTESNEVLIWYCTVDHTANTGLQPSETGPGSSYWSLTQNNNVLENLNYIRKFPGLNNTAIKWNTIEIKNKTSYGLAIFPHSQQAVDTFVIHDNSKQPAIQFTGENELVLNTGSKLWTKGSSYLSGSNWLNFTPFDSVANTPVLSVKGRSSNNAFEVVKSTASSNTSNVLFRINDTSVFTGAASHYVDGGTVEFINKLVWFSGTETQNCYGTATLDSNGEPPFTEVRFGRDAKFGTLASCNSPFVSKLNLFATTGNIETVGNITTSGTLNTYELVLPQITNADYLSTNANGKVIASSGVPSTNKIIISVTGSNTSLSNRDVVYLDNATGLWTKSQANNKLTLAVGVVDNVSGTAPNQSFSVVFFGTVAGYSGLEIGNWYWLSKNTAGSITDTRPTDYGDLVDPVGIAISSTSLFVITSRAHKLPTSDSGVPSSGNVKTDTIWDSKGDLVVATGANTADRLPIGSNGQYLVVDSTQNLGVKWTSVVAGSSAWGAISGTLSSQTDLVNALANKSDVGHSHVAGDITSGTFNISRIPTGTTSSTVSLGNHSHSDATTSASGFMSSSDKTKLNGIASGAEVNVNADWNAISGDAQILNKPTLGTAASASSTDFIASSAASAFGLTLIDDANASTARTTLGLGSAATSSTSDFASSSRTITTGDGISGGGDLTANRTFHIDLATNSGLEFATEQLRAKTKTNGGIVRDADGLSVSLPNNSVTAAAIESGAVTMAKIAQSGATTNQVIKWNGTAWSPADDATASGGSGAPSDADYLTKSSNGGLSAERVVTDSTSITANWDTAGQVAFQRAALTGDVTASANSNATTIANSAVTSAKIADDAVTFAKLQNVTGPMIVGRSAATSGSAEEIGLASAFTINLNKQLDLANALALQSITLTAGTGLTGGGNLSANRTFAVDYGTSSSTACVGNDARLSDARTPTSHVHGGISNVGAIGTTADLPIKTGASGVLEAGSFGTTSGTFCQGNDSRLSDARTPTAHTHGLTDSYVGEIASAANQDYTIDLRVPLARVVTEFSIISSSGTCTAALKNGSNTIVGSVSVSSTIATKSGGDLNSTYKNLTANDKVVVTISSNSTAVRVQFCIKYTAATGAIS